MQKQKQKSQARFVLPVVYAITAVFVLVGVILVVKPVKAATGINEQINLQGRLLDSTGAVVPDGNYNMKFRIYQDGDGVLGGGDETLKWTETREGGNKVVVKNGYFSVYLGAVTAFGSSIDWNQDTLWLSIDIGGTGTPSYDGEMTPFTRLSSSPYALNAARLGGLAASEFIKLAKGVQTDSSTSNPSIYINKTGSTANILQLQKLGSDVFVIDNTGKIVFGGDTISDFTGSGLTIVSGALTIDSTSATGFFRNGGNSFGTTATLGTNDANNLVFETNNTTRGFFNTSGDLVVGSNGSCAGDNNTIISPSSIDICTVGGNLHTTFTQQSNNAFLIQQSSQGLTIKNSTDSANSFQIQNTTGDNFLLVDTSGNTLSLCNSASCDTVSIGTNADADTINIGDSLDTITITGSSASSFVLNGVTVSASEFNVLDGGIDESEVTGVITAVTAGSGLITGGTSGAVTLDVASANGGIVVNTDNIALTLQSSADGASTTTSSGSGLEVLSGGLALLQGCSDTQILKWNETSDVWACGNDATGGGGSDLDGVYDADTDKVLAIDSTTGLLFNMTTTGDFVIQDSSTTIATFDDSGGIIFAPNSASDLTFTGDDDSQFIINNASLTNTGGVALDINVTLGNDVGGDEIVGQRIDLTSGATGDTDIFTGLYIGITSADTTVSERGLHIGPGFDYDIILEDTTPVLSLRAADNTASLTIEDISGNDILVLQDTGNAANHVLYGDANTGLEISGATTDITSTTNENLSISAGGTGDVVLALDNDTNFQISTTLTSTNSLDLQTITLTNQTSSGTQRGLVITSADDAANATTEGLIVLNNAETTANSVTDYLLITTSSADTTTDAIDVSDSDLFNAINIGTNFLVASGDSINDFTGSGLVVISNALSINLTSSGTTGSTSSSSGLEVGSSGLTLLKGCANNEILKWSDSGSGGSDTWGCAADATGGGGSDLDGVYDADTDKVLAIDSTTGLLFNMITTGDFVLQDNGSTFLTVDDTGGIAYTMDSTDNPALTVTNSGSSNITINLAGTGDFVIQDNGTVSFTVDDSGNVYVGNPTADGVGALLVLDTKNTADDPTGTNGAMYYNSNSNKFRCYEAGAWKDCDTTGGSSVITHISGSSGAAGADITLQQLTSNSADVTTTTLSSSVMSTTGVGAGTYKFKYTLIYQTAATTTGIAFGVNHTGASSSLKQAIWYHITTGGAAATGIGDDVAGTTAGQLAEGKSGSTINAVIGSASAGVATANANIMAVLEGVLVVTNSGTLELKIASEVSGSAVRIISGSLLELTKF